MTMKRLFINFRCKLIIVLIILSCNACESSSDGKNRRIVKKWINKTILFPSNLHYYSLNINKDDLFKTNYSIITYLDSIGCMSCKLNFGLWKDLIKELDSMHLNCSIKYFIHTADRKRIKSILMRDNFNYPIFFDEEDSLNILNDFPSDFHFQSFLVNKNNKVLAIGNPVLNHRIKKMYLSIIQGHKIANSLNPNAITEISMNVRKRDLGCFSYKKTKECTFFLENIGEHPFFIKNISVSCGCIRVDYDKKPILPNDKVQLKVKYKASYPGYFDKFLLIYCNVRESPLKLRVLGRSY